MKGLYLSKYTSFMLNSSILNGLRNIAVSAIVVVIIIIPALHGGGT